MKVRKCLYCGSSNLLKISYRLDGKDILRCEKCHLMMVGEISDDTQNLYKSDYFEKDRSEKNGYTNYLSSPAAILIGKFAYAKLFSKKTCKSLDIGCADGSLIELLKSEGYEASGLEISKDAVEIAQRKGLNVTNSNLVKFPKNDLKYELITAFDLLEHLDNLGSVLREVKKYLASEGIFCFSTLLVKNINHTEYWFNNSLEHYIYFDQKNLEYILNDIFGKDSYCFTEIVVNGISEVWGFVKNGKITDEKDILGIISDGSYFKNKNEDNYLLSLIYGQMSAFDKSREIIDKFSNKWTKDKTIQAKFFNNYYQGKLELAITESKGAELEIPSNSYFWQALSNAEAQIFDIYKIEVEKKVNAEIVQLREQLFNTKDQLNALLNSRIVGRIIKARNKTVHLAYKIKKSPANMYGFLKPRAAKMIPERIRKPAVAFVRKKIFNKDLRVSFVDNKLWDSSLPLVSVVIPFYKLADTIDDTLRSLDQQTFRNFEIIIVNDGTPDIAGKEKIKQLEKRRDLVVINQKNQGVAAARNNGIKAARGKYIICLDSDDMLTPTYIEKFTIILEANPDYSIVSSFMETFGVKNEVFKHANFNPIELFKNNTIITAAEFRKRAWVETGGYKSNIGYEDWEFWINLVKRGFWAKQIPEALFRYRVAMQSRYVEDKDVHWDNIKKIHSLNSDYLSRVKKIYKKRANQVRLSKPETTLINMSNIAHYQNSDKASILIAMPWMTFGGAETLILNFCREIKDEYNVHFVTGLKSENEWESKFKDISQNIYHLPNMFDDEIYYVDFIINYIKTRDIKILHMLHTNFIYKMLPKIKKSCPDLKVILTLFNDRVVEYFEPSIDLEEYIDIYVSDNTSTAEHFKALLPKGKDIKVIPNGIDCNVVFNPIQYSRDEQRSRLGIKDDEIAVFFVGRLSQEKNPDIYTEAAGRLVKNTKNTRFFIIGDGPMRDVIDNKIKSFGNGRIVNLGYQSEVAKYLSAGDIFVLPSSIEGFPLSILEAMAMRMVVIASKVGAVPDVIINGKDGYVISPGSVSNIQDCIEKVIKDREGIERIKLNARRKLEANYSNDILRKNYLKMYEEILK